MAKNMGVSPVLFNEDKYKKATERKLKIGYFLDNPL